MYVMISEGMRVINPFLFLQNELIEFFNAALVAAKIAPVGTAPVVGCQMNHEKNYAFVEFKTPEEATSGMAFDGKPTPHYDYLFDD